MEKEKVENNERFVRWQSVLREHLTFLNNLLLILSIGIVGFIINLLSDTNFNPFYGQKFFFTFGLILLLLSVLFGFSAAFSRLLDFKTTLKKIRIEIKDDNDNLYDLKIMAKLFGKLSWCLFYSQIITLILGILNLIIAFCWIYTNKLF